MGGEIRTAYRARAADEPTPAVEHATVLSRDAARCANVLLLREKKAGHINQVEGIGEILTELQRSLSRRTQIALPRWSHISPLLPERRRRLA